MQCTNYNVQYTNKMLNKIISFADEFNMFPESGQVLACVSGGADSMCLLGVLQEISHERGFTVSVAHFNHKLRGDESDRDEAFVREYCAAHSLPYYSAFGDVKAHAAKHKRSIEEAARNMRYGFFYATAWKTGAKRIATAHTADDNVETMIINLARGAGTSGLSGIPPVRGMRNTEFRIRNRCASGTTAAAHQLPLITQRPEMDSNSKLASLRESVRDSSHASVEDPNNSAFRIPHSAFAVEDRIIVIRPMLCVSRDDVIRFVTERNIPFIEDSTNNLDIYTRNKVRRTIIPVIKEINPKYYEAASMAAALLRADEEYLSGIANEYISTLKADNRSLNAGELAELPFAVSGRVIRKLYGGNLSYNHVKAVLELCKRDDTSASISLPGMVVYREYDRVVFSSGKRKTGADDFMPFYPSDGECVEISGAGLKLACKTIVYDVYNDREQQIFNKSLTSFVFKYDDLCGKMAVRPRREGDTIRLFGHNGTKTLKKLFIERRIPMRKRNLIPIIADDNGILAVYGLGRGDRAIPAPGDRAVQITFEDKP